jgi:hypothetical protein
VDDSGGGDCGGFPFQRGKFHLIASFSVFVSHDFKIVKSHPETFDCPQDRLGEGSEPKA